MTATSIHHAKSYGGVIDQLVAGEWVDPTTGKPVRLPIDSIVIESSLDGHEADLIAALHPKRPLLVVCDENTRDVLGKRVYEALKPLGQVDEYIWANPRCSEEGVAELMAETRGYETLIAVGSGTVSDSVKYATFQDGRDYSVFPTSPMNAYSTPTASVTSSGMKKSITCHSARGIFIDMEVLAHCPKRLVRAAFADVICRTTAQVDWLMSNLLFDTTYSPSPYILLAYDEDGMLDHAGELTSGNLDYLAMLTRISTIMGLGTTFTGTTHSGSMAEHMISHCIDMFAGEAHPGTSHGEQVGVTTLTLSALQNQILGADSPPEVAPTAIPDDELTARYGPEMAGIMVEQTRKKAIDAAMAERINERFAQDWDGFVEPLRQVMLPLERLQTAMAAAGCQQTPEDLGLDPAFYRQILADGRFTRDRFTALDLADDSGLLEPFVAAHP
ncbi:iron-containing alcohol dehydrogenase [Pelagibius sp.]|uniref:iron-containing alcohol dehydrogenase n=1 Tax=Pelagibius sp. TaxID=1931238 RepID=UPI003B501AD9